MRARIEYHSYTAGGGLTEKNHCDAGSTVTLSVLLTEPTDGGVFSTTDADGITTQHSSIGRGDGIVLCSEMVHNVTPLRSGSRNSLVIEWWNRGMNRCDRFRSGMTHDRPDFQLAPGDPDLQCA